jgi:hypothetical protein
MVERNVPVTFVQPPDENAGNEVHEAPPVDKPKEKTQQAPPPVRKNETAIPHITGPFIKLKATPPPVKKALPVKKHAFGNG